MQDTFNKFASKIYRAIDQEDPILAMNGIYTASTLVGTYRHNQPDYIPPLIYGEFFHLFSGAHGDLYTPEQGYYTVTPGRSAIARIGWIQAYEISDEFVLNAPQRYLGDETPIFPQMTLTDLMIMIASNTEARVNQKQNIELEELRKEREAKDIAFLRSKGYEPLEENPLAQDFFRKVFRTRKE